MSAARRFGPPALAVVVAVGTLTAGSPARAADDTAPRISEVTVTPDPVVLRAKKNGTTVLTVRARVVDKGVVDRVAVGLYDRRDDEGRAVELRLTSGSSKNGIWSARVLLPNDAKRKGWSVRAFATDLASNTTDPDAVHATFTVQQRTRLRSVNAGPEEVAAKEAITVSGVLQRYRPGTGWVGFGGRGVVLEFRADGTKNYEALERGRTDSEGAVRFEEVTVRETGRWRLAFAGNRGYAPGTSKTDEITVVAD